MAALKSLDTDVEMAKNRIKEEQPLSATAAMPLTAPSQPSTKHKQIVDTLCICLNIASTVLLVFLNKWCVPHRPPFPEYQSARYRMCILRKTGLVHCIALNIEIGIEH